MASTSTSSIDRGCIFNNGLSCDCLQKSVCGIPAPFESGSIVWGGKQVNAVPSSTEKEDMDKYLAESMNKLSVKDRETALEEVHGIAKIDQEDPTSLKLNLDELDVHLASIKRGTVYEKAELMDASYVSNRERRLMFLRCNRYDPKAAAQQMLNFFDCKQSLFGSDKLATVITLNHLDEEDKKSLQTGFCQVASQKDRAGRQIALFMPGLRTIGSAESDARANYYMFMSMLQDSEETQRKGVIALHYAVGHLRDKQNGAGRQHFSRLASALPIRWAGIHVCCDDYKQFLIPLAIIRTFSTFFAVKFRVHVGTHMECMYALRGYGIPEGALPLSPIHKKSLLESHQRWYRLQKIINSATPSETSLAEASNHTGDFTKNPSLVQDPTRIVALSEDVIFGETCKTHPGNVRLQQVVADHAQDYESLQGRQEKMDFSWNLVQHMKTTGSRFLMRDTSTGDWIVVSDIQARNRVSKAIRNRRRDRR